MKKFAASLLLGLAAIGCAEPTPTTPPAPAPTTAHDTPAAGHEMSNEPAATPEATPPAGDTPAAADPAAPAETPAPANP